MRSAAGFPASNHGSIRIRGQQRVRTTPIASALILLAACPSTDPTPPSIQEVIVESVIATPSFDLLVKGHGFGLRDVSFDLSSGTGDAKLSRQRIQVLTRNGTPPAQIRAITSSVSSPSEMRVTVYLFDPLPAGEYGVELYVGDVAEPTAELKPAFVVRSALVTGDGGVTLAPDADPTVLAPDALPGVDALEGVDAQQPVDDGGLTDPPDSGAVFFDAAAPGDSGLGPFPPGPGFRRPILLANDTGLASPVDVTMRIVVPHAQMLAAIPAQSRADGLDLAVYNGTTQLPHQIEDLALLGTDRLELIVRLTVAIPPGGSLGVPLALFSDPVTPAATPPTDAVYVFTERFANAFNSNANDPNQYNDRWEQRCPDRVTAAANGSKCRTDAENGLTRRSFATPRVLGMTANRAANELYEVVAYIAGAHQTQNDILYFSYGPDNSSFDVTTLLPEAAYDPAFRPNASQTFLEINDRNRVVTGWRLPTIRQPFQRMRASFAPAIPTPNLHFRYVSVDNQTNQNTQMILDDLVVRRALNPDFRVTLGPVEGR